MKENSVRNTVIIGGGPAGLAAAIYLARAGLTPLVFAGSPSGGQLMLTSEVENFPGHESILGSDLIDKMRKQAEKFGAQMRDENVLDVDFSKKPLTVSSLSSALDKIYSKSILIATGAKALWLGLESEQRLRGKGVSACATCDGFFFRNKTVAVLGGGDSALEEALTLTKFASKVYLIHRRDSFRASKIMQQRVKENPKIEVILNAGVEEIMGDTKVTGIKFQTPNSKPQHKSQIIPLDGVFVAIGHKPDTDLFKNRIELDEKGYVITTARKALMDYQLKNDTSLNIDRLDINHFNPQYQSMTSVAGVFAAGDCVDIFYRQAATAAGLGVAASLDIERWLERT